jgi:hypothetical protein
VPLLFLTKRVKNLNPVDRWGGTPLTDAEKGNHTKIIEILKNEETRL